MTLLNYRWQLPPLQETFALGLLRALLQPTQWAALLFRLILICGSNGGTGYTINNVPAGTYTVSAISGTDTATATVTIVSDPSALTLVTTSDSSLTGNNGTATVNVTGGTPPYTYRWTPGGATTDSLDSLAPGTYTVTVRDSFGCTYRDSAIVYGITAINQVSAEMPQINLYPNPANSLMNVVIESPKTLVARIEALDMTGQVVYSTQATIGNHYNLKLKHQQFQCRYLRATT